MTLEERLRAKATEIARMSASVDATLARLTSSTDMRQLVNDIALAVNELTLLRADTSKGSVRRVVTYGAYTLRDLIDYRLPELGQVDRDTLIRYYKLLRSAVHSDRGGGQAGVSLHEVKAAYATGSIELLHLYMLMTKHPDADFRVESLQRSLSLLLRREAVLRDSQSFRVTATYRTRGETDALHQLNTLLRHRLLAVRAAIIAP